MKPYRPNTPCHICGLPIPAGIVSRTHPLFGTIDHIQPRSLGGTDAASNRAPAHGYCNWHRGNRVLTDELRCACKQTIVELFATNPGLLSKKALLAAGLPSRKTVTNTPFWRRTQNRVTEKTQSVLRTNAANH